ncbi:Phosphate/pyrophosphate-specific outer membrane porin OprP/OprO [Methylomonas albis]|uniref:Porin n=1 Tax=Methylomonas albis TaxID=1854563 RepID=A0ABR9CWB4_9GAMM|nr:porin [Methylomonas albis]MBD9354990.1 porin [Methylomonas albis]CAD6877916.1 Phosphate/pyrophosphate-specific outer membrane porin OprP/OprO [Methylomonas albis]
MRLSKLSLAVAAIIGSGIYAEAMALDLYVDAKTKQIFAEPGPGRTKLGSFEKVEDTAAQKADAQVQKAEIQQIKEELALKTNELKSLDEHVKDERFGELKIDDKGIKFESKDGNFEMSINGRMQVDSMTNVSGSDSVANATGANTTNQLADGAGIRRARIGIEGSYYKDFGYKFEYDFARGNGTVASGITDAFMTWNGYAPFAVKIGQFKEPFSLEEATSNRYLTFIERNNVVNAFSDNDNAYKVGLGLGYSQPRWTANIALQTESVGSGGASSSTSSLNTMGNTNRNNGSGDTGWGVTGRVTGLPWFEDKTKFLHVGLSGSERQIDNNFKSDGTFSNGGISFGNQLNTNVDRTYILNTGQLTANGRIAQRIARFGGETALVYGPFSAQAEYIQANVSGKGYNDEMLNGWYGYGSYFLTGESRAYKTSTGAWDRIKPKQNFNTHGGWGAWEIAAGYDYLNLVDGNINGGRATTGKVGVNWYPNSHIRLMANFIHALNIDTKGMAARSAAYNSSNFDVVEMRAQVDW